jgi:hypothetical protein
LIVKDIKLAVSKTRVSAASPLPFLLFLVPHPLPPESAVLKSFSMTSSNTQPPKSSRALELQPRTGLLGPSRAERSELSVGTENNNGEHEASLKTKKSETRFRTFRSATRPQIYNIQMMRTAQMTDEAEKRYIEKTRDINDQPF